MRIVFHGANAHTFCEGIDALLDRPHEIAELPDELGDGAVREVYIGAEVIVGIRFDAAKPVPSGLKLFQVPGAGYDGVNVAALPAGAALCNCFGHENAIAEYVMAALLARHVPLVDADRRLRAGDWKYWAGGPGGLRTELGATTLGIVGFGHIGKELAARAKAFGMRVHVANRSAVASPDLVDAAYALSDLERFMGSAQAIVNTLPLTEDTKGLLGAAALGAMRSDAVILNVGRGAVIDEGALFQALKQRRIAGAVIDTWYVYPDGGNASPRPGNLPFHELDNVTVTPHMSGWTHGTIRRRREAIADNINRCASGKDLKNRIL